MNRYLTSFYHKEDGVTTVHLGIFEGINSDDVKKNHLRFFCRTPEEGEIVKTYLQVYELTKDTAYVILVEQAAGILDDNFIFSLSSKWPTTDFAMEYHIKD